MKQLNPLTGLRGVAAYAVLLAHGICSSFNYGGEILFQAFAQRIAYFGMSLFFVLSGFVIHYNYAKLIKTEGFLKGGYKFIVARIARLYPLYGLAILFTLDKIPSAHFHNQGLGVLAFLTMTQSWFNLQMLTFQPAWSISTEWFFYFTFIITLPLFEKIRRPLITMVAFLIASFLLLPCLLQFQIDTYRNTNGWVAYFSPFTRIFDFVAGVLASKTYLALHKDDNRKISLLGYGALLVLLGFCILIIAFDPLSKTQYGILLPNFVFTPFIAPLLFLFCRYDTFLSRVLCAKPFTFIGEISYSVYLLGFLVMTALGDIYVSKDASVIAYINSSFKIVVIFTFTTFMAYGCYNLFEKPMRTWVRQVLTLKSKRKEIFEAIPETVGYELK
jgi:peptidoglycan/LPS O-acetylase OafA/YrhL